MADSASERRDVTPAFKPCPLASTFFGVDARVRRMFLPPPSNPNAKLGFSTYAMWALCVVVVGVCYKLEQNELSARPAGLVGIPDTVQKVMPSGAWLMSARRALCSYRCYSAHSPHCVVGRGRLHPEGQLNPPSCKLPSLSIHHCLDSRLAAIIRVLRNGLGCARPG